jgi:CheY-like chemotaxis protein
VVTHIQLGLKTRSLGPRKLAKILTVAILRWHELHQDAPPPLASVSSNAATSSKRTTEKPDNDSDLEQRKMNLTSRPADAATVAASPAEEQEYKSDRGTRSPDMISLLTIANSKFLLVDDNPINIKILATYMNRLGQTYSTATNGREAVDAYQAAPGLYSCIFMDISMPVMDGFEATRHIRNFERDNSLDKTFILALSGLASESAQQEAYGSGINLFMAKPVRQNDLKEVLVSQQLLQKSPEKGIVQAPAPG